MENRLQATFMPRQTAVSGNAYSRPKGPTNFFMMIGVLVFVLVLLALGGLFAYKIFLTESNQKKQVEIEEAIKNFEPELTRELTILKARMDAGKTLLDNHKAFSLLFTLLEMNTAQTVQFKEFSYIVSPDKTIKLAMKGEARSYNAVAFQSDILSKVEQFRNTMFTNIDLSDTGTITFDFVADLDPTTVLYKKLISGDIPIAPVEGATASTTVTSMNTGTTTPPNQPGS